MTSERQQEANQQNAQYSSGPKSVPGKRRSSKNAITHGLTCCIETQMELMPWEDPDIFDQHMRSYLDEYEPVGQVERNVVVHIGEYAWMDKRAVRALNRALAMAESGEGYHHQVNLISTYAARFQRILARYEQRFYKLRGDRLNGVRTMRHANLEAVVDLAPREDADQWTGLNLPYKQEAAERFHRKMADITRSLQGGRPVETGHGPMTAAEKEAADEERFNYEPPFISSGTGEDYRHLNTYTGYQGRSSAPAEDESPNADDPPVDDSLPQTG
jgi:hypothetical protein